MSKTKRARRTGRLTVDEFAEYMAITTMERLSTMPPGERDARAAAFRKIITEVRTKRGRKPRIHVSRAPSRQRAG